METERETEVLATGASSESQPQEKNPPDDEGKLGNKFITCKHWWSYEITVLSYTPTPNI